MPDNAVTKTSAVPALHLATSMISITELLVPAIEISLRLVGKRTYLPIDKGAARAPTLCVSPPRKA